MLSLAPRPRRRARHRPGASRRPRALAHRRLRHGRPAPAAAGAAAGGARLGGARASDVLVADLLQEPARARLLGSVGRPAERIAAAVRAGARAAAVGDDGRWRPGVTAESVLWEIWRATGVAESWRRTALAGGPPGAGRPRPRRRPRPLRRRRGLRRPAAHGRARDLPRARAGTGRARGHAARRCSEWRPGLPCDAADRRRSRVAHRRRRGRAGGGLARPAPARLHPRVGGSRRRAGRPRRWASAPPRPRSATTRPASSTSP